MTSHHFHYHCIRRGDTYHESWYGALALSNFRKGIIDGRHIILTSIATLGEDRSRDTIRCLVLAEARSRDVTLRLTRNCVIRMYSPLVEIRCRRIEPLSILTIVVPRSSSHIWHIGVGNLLISLTYMKQISICSRI